MKVFFLTILFVSSLSFQANAQCLTLNAMKQILGNNLENLGSYLQTKGYEYNRGWNEGSFSVASWSNQQEKSGVFAYIGNDEMHQKLIGINEIEYRFGANSTCYNSLRSEMRTRNFVKDKEEVSKEGVLTCYYSGTFNNSNGDWPVGIVIEMPSQQQVLKGNGGKHYKFSVMSESTYKFLLKK